MKKRTIKNKVMALIGAAIVFAGHFCGAAEVYAGTPYTGISWEFYIAGVHTVLESDHSTVEKKVIMHYDAVTDGTVKRSMTEWRIDPYCAEKIWFGEPQLGGCSQCKELAKGLNLFSTRVFLEDDSGTEYVSRSGHVLTKEDLKATGLDFENLPNKVRAGLEIIQTPGPVCSACGRHVGDTVTVDNLYWEMKTLTFISQPSSVYVNPGDSATFSFVLGKYTDSYNRPMDYYKWQRCVAGFWEDIYDGPGPKGERYSGSDTRKLVVDNITQDMRGLPIRCELKGDYGFKIYTETVTIDMPEPTNPPVTAAPTPPPITPSPGSAGTDYKPSTSSSTYVPGGGGAAATPVPGKSSSSSSHEGIKGNDSYSGPIGGGGGGSSSRITAADQVSPGSGTSAKNPSSGKGGSSAKAGLPAKAGSSAQAGTSGSSSNITTRPTQGNYVMKNGVLYVIDDANPDTGVQGSSSSEADTVENVENEMTYQASELGSLGEVNEREMEKGFFSTVPGIITLAGSALLILLLLVFFLFFGVIVLGEVEEHDEVFEICAVRLIRRREGNWYVRLGGAFDDNAVLKLRIGLLFAVIFEGWDMVGETTGSYEGTVTGQVEQGMLLYRKSVRRTV